VLRASFARALAGLAQKRWKPRRAGAAKLSLFASGSVHCVSRPARSRRVHCAPPPPYRRTADAPAHLAVVLLAQLLACAAGGALRLTPASLPPDSALVRLTPALPTTIGTRARMAPARAAVRRVYRAVTYARRARPATTSPRISSATLQGASNSMLACA
jgi:hypothetical protein